MSKVILFCLLGFPFLLHAQIDSSVTQWSVTLHIGPYLSGVPGNIDKAMESKGFAKTNGLFGSTPSSENMVRKKPVYSLGIERITAKAWSQKFLLSVLSGYVWGFSPTYGNLRIDYAQIASSLLIGYHSKQKTTRIAVGPSLHFTTLKTPSYSSSSLQETLTNFGFTLEAGLRFPAKKRVFFDFNTQYHFVGKQDLGTYSFGQSGEMKVGKKSVNYLCFNFGLGLRLGK